MRISKISSKVTYHKCLKFLHAQGYVNYEPSYNPFRGSHVYLFDFADDLKPLSKTEKNAKSNFEPVAEQVVNKLKSGRGAGAGRVAEQVVIPSINNTNISNIKNIANGLNGREPSGKNKDEDFLKNDIQKEEKSSAKKEENGQTFAHTSEFDVLAGSLDGIQPPVNPTEAEVLNYFLEENHPELEARKFFNFFQSIGWLVGGKTPMADWKAAAQNWILNIPKYQPPPKQDRHLALNTSTEKDYAEPL